MGDGDSRRCYWAWKRVMVMVILPGGAKRKEKSGLLSSRRRIGYMGQPTKNTKLNRIEKTTMNCCMRT